MAAAVWSGHHHVQPQRQVRGWREALLRTPVSLSPSGTREAGPWEGTVQSFQPKLLKEGRAFIHREERAGRRPVFRVKSAKAVRVGPGGGGAGSRRLQGCLGAGRAGGALLGFPREEGGPKPTSSLYSVGLLLNLGLLGEKPSESVRHLNLTRTLQGAEEQRGTGRAESMREGLPGLGRCRLRSRPRQQRCSAS